MESGFHNVPLVPTVHPHVHPWQLHRDGDERPVGALAESCNFTSNIDRIFTAAHTQLIEIGHAYGCPSRYRRGIHAAGKRYVLLYCSAIR